MVKSFSDLDQSKTYTYQDYLGWQFEEMVELIKGKIFKMSPAPNLYHQRNARKLTTLIDNFLAGKTCEVFTAPFDVRIPTKANQEIITVVQPDICVVCDPDKLDIRGCLGAPDWIIEILSNSTANKDLNEKFDLYEAAGVSEYWIVHPSEATITPYRLTAEGKYQLLRDRPYTVGESIPVTLFSDFEVELAKVF